MLCSSIGPHYAWLSSNAFSCHWNMSLSVLLHTYTYQNLYCMTNRNQPCWVVRVQEKNLCSFYFLERWRPINNFLAVRNTMVNFLINKGSRYIITFSVHAAFALKIPIPCKKLSDIFKSKQFASLIHFLQYEYICEIIFTA